jgi:hypothetical protein
MAESRSPTCHGFIYILVLDYICEYITMYYRNKLPPTPSSCWTNVNLPDRPSVICLFGLGRNPRPCTGVHFEPVFFVLTPSLKACDVFLFASVRDISRALSVRRHPAPGARL